MKKAFIWVSGLSFIDKKKKLMARNFFGFLAKSKPVQRFRKTNNIPTANWLKGTFFTFYRVDCISSYI